MGKAMSKSKAGSVFALEDGHGRVAVFVESGPNVYVTRMLGNAAMGERQFTREQARAIWRTLADLGWTKTEI